MRRWMIRETEKGSLPLPTQAFLCPFCGTEMLIHDFSAYYQKGRNFYHVDVHMKCPNCSFWCVFGVPISKEEYLKLYNSSLHGKIIYKDIMLDIRDENVEKEVKRRLRELGYW